MLNMGEVSNLDALEVELKKVEALDGSMTIVAAPKEYAEKVFSLKRDVDTAVIIKDHVIVGILGVSPDLASAIFHAIPKGMAFYPKDGRDVHTLVSTAVDRLKISEAPKGIRIIYEKIRPQKATDIKSEEDKRFISSPFYQFYAFLARKLASSGTLSEGVKRLLYEYVPYGMLNKEGADDEAGSLNPEEVDKYINNWGYEERYEAKIEQGKKTLRRFRNIEHLFTLPSISRQIMNVSDDPLLSASKMAKIIEKDPVLTSKILKVVNSAFYGFPRKIESVEHAVVILGNEEVVNLAFSIAVSRIVHDVSPAKAQALWEHSLQVAFLSHWLAPRIGHERKDLVYTVGLLHDLGKIVFLQGGDNMGNLDNMSTIDDLAEEEGKTGLSHAEMGAYLAERWNLPEAIVDGIHAHHMPMLSSRVPIAITVHLADCIAHIGYIDMDMVNAGVIRFVKEQGLQFISNEVIEEVYLDIKSKVKFILEV